MTLFNKGQDLNTTIISTGIEQSFIINQQTQGQFDIINVNQKNDIQNISADEIRQNVIILLTNQNLDLNPNNIKKIVENFASTNIHFVTEEDMMKQIKECIEIFEGKERDLQQNTEDSKFNTRSEKHNLDESITFYKEDKESKALEHFEHKDVSPQREIDFKSDQDCSDKIDVDRELER
jgi:hypothetical protein